MDLGIAGKTVLVTGASQGIGEATALAFANEGARVIVTARRADRLASVVEKMGGESGGHCAIPTDLMEPGKPTWLAEEILSRFAELDIVVHNVGGTLSVKNPLSPVDDWLRVWRHNVGIAIEMNGILIPPMRERKWGRVVHISSISAETTRGSAPYVSAKAALNGYIKGLARAVAPDGVVVSGLMPGAVLSEGGHWDDVLRNRPEVVPDFLRHHMAVGRLGTAEEIACWALFLASEQAKFAIGALLPIDGGTM